MSYKVMARLLAQLAIRDQKELGQISVGNHERKRSVCLNSHGLTSESAVHFCNLRLMIRIASRNQRSLCLSPSFRELTGSDQKG